MKLNQLSLLLLSTLSLLVILPNNDCNAFSTITPSSTARRRHTQQLHAIKSTSENKQCCNSLSSSSQNTRREMFHDLLLPTSLLLLTPTPAKAIPSFLGGGKERRQLELCLVTIIRLRYWAQSVGTAIATMRKNAPPTGLTDIQKAPYLEARLGAKASLTGKVGGGANSRVVTLASFQIKDCVKDAQAWYDDEYFVTMKQLNNNNNNNSGDEKAQMKKQRFFLEGAAEAIVESLGAVVEFDGLETTQDPSPRSSLALSMYKDSKAEFIQRMLLERTVVNCDIFVNSFGSDRRRACENYIRLYYSNEIPKVIPVVTEEDT